MISDRRILLAVGLAAVRHHWQRQPCRAADTSSSPASAGSAPHVLGSVGLRSGPGASDGRDERASGHGRSFCDRWPGDSALLQHPRLRRATREVAPLLHGVAGGVAEDGLRAPVPRGPGRLRPASHPYRVPSRAPQPGRARQESHCAAGAIRRRHRCAPGSSARSSSSSAPTPPWPRSRRSPRRSVRRRSQTASRQRRRSMAMRASQHVDVLRGTLEQWFGFYNGYDPAFTAKVPEPYRALSQAAHRIQSNPPRIVAGLSGAPPPATLTDAGGGGGRGGRGGGGGAGAAPARHRAIARRQRQDRRRSDRPGRPARGSGGRDDPLHTGRTARDRQPRVRVVRSRDEEGVARDGLRRRLDEGAREGQERRTCRRATARADSRTSRSRPRRT